MQILNSNPRKVPNSPIFIVALVQLDSRDGEIEVEQMRVGTATAGNFKKRIFRGFCLPESYFVSFIFALAFSCVEIVRSDFVNCHSPQYPRLVAFKAGLPFNLYLIAVSIRDTFFFSQTYKGW